MLRVADRRPVARRVRVYIAASPASNSASELNVNVPQRFGMKASEERSSLMSPPSL
jgi:hypothetical protein